MRLFVVVLALLSVWMAVPTSVGAQPKLEFIPVCERAPDGWPGPCRPESYVYQRARTTFLSHIMKRINRECEIELIDPEARPTPGNFVLVSCPPMTIDGVVELE